jgi:nucleotide-binding universal stress UspA family protein
MNAHRFPPRTILVPTDMSGASASALTYARLLQDQFGAKTHVLHSQYFEMPPYFSSGQLDLLTRELARSRRAAAEYLRREIQPELGPNADVIIREKSPVAAILESAQELDIDLIVMGTHGRRGAERLWLGSTAERVLRESRHPVLAVHENSRAQPFQHLLCPINRSDAGRAAVEYAARIAEASHARLSVMHAAEPGEPPMECPLVAESIRAVCQVEETVLHGDAARTILETVSSIAPDLVVMGTDRKPSIFGELFSSTTQKVMQAAPVPIIVVPKI